MSEPRPPASPKPPLRGDADEGVTHLWRYRAAMAYPLLAEVEAYWEGLRPRGALPARTEIDPRGLERALGHAFMIEHTGGGVGLLRIAGSHLARLAGAELRGRALSALFAPSAHETLHSALEEAFATPGCLRLSLEAPEGPGAPALSGALVVLPLDEPCGTRCRALGCLETRGEPGRAPRLLEISGLHLRPVALYGAAAGDAPTGAGGLEEPRAHFRPAPRQPEPPRGHLRLITSRKPKPPA